jgi:hypothetical protein
MQTPYEKYFLKVYDQVQFYWTEGCRQGQKNKNYKKAISLILKALSLIDGSELDEEYKNHRRIQFYNRIADFSLRDHDFKLALEYAKKCNDPRWIGDAYYGLMEYRDCLEAYSLLKNAGPPTNYQRNYIQKKRIKKTIEAFFVLIDKNPKDYCVENLKTIFPWLYEQVIKAFVSLDNAFKYYNLEKDSELAIQRSQTQEIEFDQEFDESLKKILALKEYSSKQTNKISKALNTENYQNAKIYLLSLYKKLKSTEKKIGIPIPYLSFNIFSLVEYIADLYLLSNELEDTVDWTYSHLYEHYRIVDYYLKLKFSLDKDINGRDIVAIGFQKQYMDNVAFVIINKKHKLYKPSEFAIRNKEQMIEIAETLLQDYKSSLGNSYLNYLYEKHFTYGNPLPPKLIDNFNLREKIILNKLRYEFGLSDQFFKDSFFIDNQVKIEWYFRFSFSHLEELNALISELNTNAENQLRREKGLPNIGVGWKSENEVFAFVKDLLPDHGVYQHYCPEWLSPMHLDVFVPDINMAIEYQGQQHYKPVNHFGGEKAFGQLQIRDRIKKTKCEKKKTKLLYIRFDDENPEETITTFIRNNYSLL